jgi:hypothetical protein
MEAIDADYFCMLPAIFFEEILLSDFDLVCNYVYLEE